ncbi:hypothetical protein GE061_000016 [Apolygus lucorum]|uniref:Peptidase A2 domain-containing protein n=1 Tax=Apolygus lucorum TaxID=248454 RepID=A0A8S9Y762_APOLU|nr:hypothetical protein GE061_000016 [Apolygus lucorum]
MASNEIRHGKISNSITSHFTDVYKLIVEHQRQVWSTTYTNADGAGAWTRAIIQDPLRPPWFSGRRDLNRRYITTINRLLLGHAFTNSFKFLMKKRNDPDCDLCEQHMVQDLQHLLLKCTRTRTSLNPVLHDGTVGVDDRARVLEYLKRALNNTQLYFPSVVHVQSTHMSSSGRKTKRPHQPTLKFLEHMEQVRNKQRRTESTQPVALKKCSVPIQRLTEEQIRKWSRAEVSGDQNQQSRTDIVRYFPSTHMSSSGRKTKRPHHPTLKFLIMFSDVINLQFRAENGVPFLIAFQLPACDKWFSVPLESRDLAFHGCVVGLDPVKPVLSGSFEQTTVQLEPTDILMRHFKSLLARSTEGFVNPCRLPALPTNSHDSLFVGFQLLFEQQLRHTSDLCRTSLDTMISAFREMASLQPLCKLEVPIFDGQSEDPETWMKLYERACNINKWDTDLLKIYNMVSYFPSGTIAQKWFFSRFSSDSLGDWDSWKTSFLSGFGVNPVQSARAALEFKYEGGPLMEFYYEKLKLIHMAFGYLSDRAVNSLILLGLPEPMQHQATMLNYDTREDLRKIMERMRVTVSYSSLPASVISQEVTHKALGIVSHHVCSISQKLPSVNLKINGVEINALLDTGASVDLINKKLIGEPQWKLRRDNLTLFGFNGAKENVDQSVEVSIAYGDRIVKSRAYVCASIGFEFIMSYSTLNKLGFHLVNADVPQYEEKQVVEQPSVEKKHGPVVSVLNQPPSEKTLPQTNKVKLTRFQNQPGIKNKEDVMKLLIKPDKPVPEKYAVPFTLQDNAPVELMEQVRKKRMKTESAQPVVLKYCTVPIQRLTEEQIRKWSRAEVSGDQNQQSQADVVRNDEDSQPSGEELQLSESFEHLSLHDDIEDSESPRDVEDGEQSRSCARLEEDPLENSKEVIDEALAIPTEQTPDVEDGEQSRSCAGLEEDLLENSKEVIDEALAIPTEQTPDVEDGEQSRSCAGLEEDPLENSKEVIDEALAIPTEQTPDVEDGEQSRSCAGLEEDPLVNSKEVIDEALTIPTEQTPDVEDGEQSRSCAGLEEDPLENSKEVIDEALAIPTEQTPSCSCPEEETEDNPSVNIEERSLGSRSESPWSDGPFFPVHVQPPELPIQASYVRSANPAWQQVIDDDIFRYLYEPSSPNPNISSEVIMYAERMRHLDMIDDCIAAYSRIFPPRHFKVDKKKGVLRSAEENPTSWLECKHLQLRTLLGQQLM